MSTSDEQRKLSPHPSQYDKLSCCALCLQLLGALDALKDFGILHTDIKPDNIMLVDAVNKPFRAKLIDFGLAVPTCSVQPGQWMQPIGYR